MATTRSSVPKPRGSKPLVKKTTRRYDRSWHALNRHATYDIADYLTGGN